MWVESHSCSHPVVTVVRAGEYARDRGVRSQAGQVSLAQSKCWTVTTMHVVTALAQHLHDDFDCIISCSCQKFRQSNYYYLNYTICLVFVSCLVVTLILLRLIL